MANQIDNRNKQPTKSTGFQNVQDIVQANRQNRLGQAVTTGVSNIVGKNQTDLNKQKEQFQQGAQKNQIGTAADQAYVQQTIANPNASQENVDRFARLRSGLYQGPTQLSNQEQLQAQSQDLQGIANAATGEYGRRGLLQRFVAPNNQYTQGQQRVDTLLLGQTGGQALNQARRQANLYGQELGQAQQSAAAQGLGLTQQARDFGENVTGQLGQAQTGLHGELAARQELSNKQSEAAREALKAILTKGTKPEVPAGEYSTMPVGTRPTISQEQYDLAKSVFDQSGLGGDTVYNPEYYVDHPEQFIGENASQATLQSVATDQDKQRALALAKLAGGVSSDFSEDTQIGGFDPLSFLNKEQYQSAISKSKKDYDARDALLRAKDFENQAVGKAQIDQQVLQDWIRQNNPEVVNSQNQLNYRDKIDAGGVFMGTGPGAGYTGGGKGYILDKNIADQLRQGYNQFSNLYGQAQGEYGGQNLNTNLTGTNFDNYLHSLYAGKGNARWLDPAESERSVFDALGTDLGGIDSAVKNRENLGASDKRNTLLERLQGLISNG